MSIASMEIPGRGKSSCRRHKHKTRLFKGKIQIIHDESWKGGKGNRGHGKSFFAVVRGLESAYLRADGGVLCVITWRLHQGSGREEKERQWDREGEAHKQRGGHGNIAETTKGSFGATWAMLWSLFGLWPRAEKDMMSWR